MKKNHLFFDLDNTLWDFNKNSELALSEMYREQRIEEKHGVPFCDFHSKYYEIYNNITLLRKQALINFKVKNT